MTGADVTPALDLSDAVAVVTGAGSGLGRAEAVALAAAGARVVVNDVVNNSDAVDVIDEIEAVGGKAVLVSGDVAERATADAMLTAAVEHFGGLNIIVNNAGITRDRMLFNMSDDEWDAVVRIHLRGHFLLSRNAATHWRRQAKETGAPVYGRVVNTSSEAGLVGSEGQANYAAAKAGIAALTVATARGLARFGVTANAICPRARTAMTAGVFGAPPSDGPDPLSVDHVTPLVTWLASRASADVSGQVFVVHGGLVALMAPPTVAARFDAPAGRWTPSSIGEQMGAFFADHDPGRTFASPDVLGLA